MLMLACSSCMMVQMLGVAPGAGYFVMCLVPAFLAYLVASRIEAKMTMGGLASSLTIFLAVSLFGLALFPFVFVLMILILPLLLGAKLFSPRRSARVAAVVGLLPFLCVWVWQESVLRTVGDYWRLDQDLVSETYLAHQRWDSQEPYGLSIEELVSGLSNGSAVRRQNAERILLLQAGREQDLAILEATLQKLRLQQQAGALHPDSVKMLDEYETRLAERKEVANAEEMETRGAAEPKGSASQPKRAQPSTTATP